MRNAMGSIKPRNHSLNAGQLKRGTVARHRFRQLTQIALQGTTRGVVLKHQRMRAVTAKRLEKRRARKWSDWTEARTRH